jgi:glutaminyl-peptide cyclotransferase
MALALSDESDKSSSGAARQTQHGSTRLWTWLIVMTGIIASILIGSLAFVVVWERDSGASAMSSQLVIPKPYDANRAEKYLRVICDLGPRPSGSEAMEKQQKMLSDFFTNAGATVEMQGFDTRHPMTGEPVRMQNLIAKWYPERPKRFLLCAHYDTRPFPDRDPVNPRGVFVGANDGGSGVAAMMEMSHHMDRLPNDIGVDVVLFDGEELVYAERRDEYFLGSTFFARQYVLTPPPIRYQAGILLDMIGDRELRIYYERNSWNYARELCKSVFETAEILKVDAFVPRIRHEVRDDHLPLNEIAKIPTIDLIDFDYPRPGVGVQQYWHTTKDVPENCSGHSIATVVYVVHQWLMRQ